MTGSQTSDGISNLRIVSFGREYILTAPLILQLRNFSVNGIQLSYEEGYKEYGGRTLYVTFTQGFTFGSVRLKVLSVNEKGGMRIFDKEPAKE